MKRAVLLVLLLLSLAPAFAGEHAAGVGQSANTDKPKVEYHGVGTINRVEPIIGLINISHGDVPFAGWNAYTRDLRVRPKELLQGLTPGMQIRFHLTAIDPLTYVITALEPIQ